MPRVSVWHGNCNFLELQAGRVCLFARNDRINIGILDKALRIKALTNLTDRVFRVLRIHILQD